MTNDFSATFFHHKGSTVRGIVERSIRAIPSPFSHFPDSVGGGVLSRVHYSGYEISSTFTLLQSPKDEIHFGMWYFLFNSSCPKADICMCRTSGRAVITGDYFEATGPDYLKVADNHVRFKLDSMNRRKIGIRKTEVLGRAAFLSNPGGAGGDQATLVVRNFLNNPSAHYSDVPLHTPTGTHDSVQSYNYNTGPTGFGELEYHTLCISRRMPDLDPRVTDTNQVWAFTGKREDLTPIAASGCSTEPERLSPYDGRGNFHEQDALVPIIHPTALISKEARLANDVTVGPYAIIDGAVTLGEGCKIHAHGHLIGPLTMGQRNVVHTGAVVGGMPQDRKFKDDHSETIIGSDNIIREHVTINRAHRPEHAHDHRRPLFFYGEFARGAQCRGGQ